MPRQSFFVNGKYLGHRDVPAFVKIPGFEPRLQHSYCIYCLRCGEIWARFLVEGAPLHQIRCLPCAKHGDGRISSPQSWTDDPLRIDATWPEAAVRYEFGVSLALAEKELNNAP